MLQGKIAVITGASRGIGKAIAERFASEGAFVIINYNGSKEHAQEVKREILEHRGNAEIMQCNVADFAACETFIKQIVDKYGRIDVLVNNAGITKDGLLMRMSEEAFDDVIATNLKGAFHCIRFASRYMMKQRQGKNYQYVFGCRYLRQCGPGKLRRVQSRNHWIDKVCSKGTWKPRDYGQCHCTRIYSDRYD